MIYGTAQLQGNVHTRLKCMWDASKAHAGHIWDDSKTHPKHALDVSVQVQNAVIKLQQDVRECHILFRQIQDVSETHAGRIWDTCEF